MLKIKDIMTTEVFALSETQTLEIARSLMEMKRIRHVPVVDKDKRFVGLLTHRDLLAQTISLLADMDESEQYDLDRHIPLMNVMTKNVITADPEMDLCSAIPILLKNKYGCLPVVSEEVLVGIVTEADFLELTYDLLKNKKQF